MTRHVFIWFVLTYTYYQTCSASNLIQFDQSPNYQSPLYGSFQRDIENLQSVNEKSQVPENAPYSSVIENLRNSWSMPSVYLQKRGYIKDVPEVVPRGFQEETEVKNDESKINAIAPSRKVSRDTKNEIESYDKDSCLENDEKGGPDTPTAEHVVKEVATPKPGFFTKIKNLFTRKNLSTLTEEDEQVALKELTDSLNLLQNDYDHELYDVSSLQNPSENVIDWSLPKRSYQKRKYNDNDNKHNWIQKPFCSNCPERPTVEHNIFAKDLNSEELFKNLSQTDIEYVKNFLKCFKENKSKFVTEYLHVSPPPPHSEKSNETITPMPSAATSNSTTVSSASNSTTVSSASNSTTKPTTSSLLNCTTITANKTKADFKNLTVTPSALNATKTNTSECCDEQNDLNTDQDLNSTDNIQNGCKPNENVNVKPVSLELLKFLAHMHHDVTQVGKPPHKPINLETLNNNSDVLGAQSAKNCTPFRLNELSLDLEVGSANNSKTRSPLSMNYIKKRSSEIGNNKDWSGNDIIAQFLEGQRSNQLNSFRIQSPYADNFLDQTDAADGDSHSQDIDKGNHFLSKFSKKREVAHSEEEILSDISSSLSKLAFDPLIGKGSRDDDYLEKIKNDNSNEEDYYFDEEHANQPRYDGKLERRNRKKKKNKKLHMRNDVDAKADEPMEAIAEPEIGSKDIFSDFQDIKFRMNPRQEEDIQTFIESLNSPPEIFSFDVDKFIKQPERVTKELKPELIPQRKYYEFIETPAIENEQIPLFQPNLESSKEIAKNEIALNLEHAEKRDLLRQYIKGISNQLHAIGRLHEEARNIKEPFEKRDQVKLPIEETPMFVNNYPQNYENVYNQKLNDKNNKLKEAEEVDDFVDKYYLLNDGSVQIYHPQKINLKQSYDPEVLQMDLDLNKKFKDLTLTRGAYNPMLDEKQKV